EGGAGAALRRAGGRASAAAGVRGRPRRHAHADAPGGLPRRGHLGPPAAGGERPRPARARRGRPPERSLPGATPRACGMSVPAFKLPEALEAHEPPEARGLARDGVRLMVATRRDGRLVHASFRDLPRFLAPGDLLVLNTSATMPAALEARRADGARVALHLSTPSPDRS